MFRYRLTRQCRLPIGSYWPKIVGYANLNLMVTAIP